jgi:UDP-N-acetylmuramoyl-tripeptide--D-alanyl-D-alanine ligase
MVTTQGNLNTYYYLPGYLTLLNDKHRLLLLEMGMKSLNDIRRQCMVVKPHVGAVTNVGEAHVGSLGNLSLVVKAKQEMVEGVRPGGILYTNADDPRSRKLNLSLCRGKVRTFGITNRADVKGSNIKFSNRGMTFHALTEGKKYSFFIPIYGIHNVYNALAAIGIARSFGVPFPTIQKGLATFQAPKMRLQFLQSRSGRTLINDAWNASPSSMKAGLSILKHIYPKRPKIAVLGDMLELGNLSYSLHFQIGKYVAMLGLHQLVTVGKNGNIIAKGAIAGGMSPNKVFSYYSLKATVHHLLTKTPANAVLYFKASRKLHFENLVKQLR